MGKYGLRIKNLAAGSIYGVNQGVREHYDYTNAALTNSLFLDYMISIGMDVYKEKSTRAIVGITFEYGTRSYEEEIAHLEKALATASGEKVKRIEQLIENANANKDKFEKVSKEDIRVEFYEKGFDLHYDEGKTTIHYQMLYRSAAKAKKGTCMFVDSRLYEQARDFLWMGIELPQKNAPIVEIGAYASLVSSTIIDRIQINPQDVLILEDVDSTFQTNVISIETDKDKHCKAVRRKNYEVTNTIFDGQALIDLSIFPDYADGYVLLRQHFTKCAAFATDIQGFFRDYFGDEYDTAVVKDMFGNYHSAKDIKLITTNNAMKWLKFGVSYEYWASYVHGNGCMWGIVKTAHKSKLGDVQRMSYQMINTLSEEIMDDVMEPSKEYIKALKTDTPTFIDFLRRNATFSNDYEVLVALYEQDHTFEQCDYFRKRKTAILQTYIKKLRNGKLIQNADNLTIVGSPYAMLLHSVGEDVYDDPTLQPEDGTIQCYTERFDDGEYLAAFRSPFNSASNMDYLHNVYHPYMKKYFQLGKLIIAVNMLHTDFQDKNNGSDQDSDVIYTTNKESIVGWAKYCYEHYPTIVNNIPEQKKHYDNTLENFAIIDNQIAAGQLDIGESSNVAQTAQAYKCTFDDKKLDDYICILSVLAQVAIDSAKRLFDVSVSDEIARIKSAINIKENGYPLYWKIIATNTKKRKELNGATINNKINMELQCPMNHVFKLKVGEYKPSTETLPIKDFFVNHSLEVNKDVSRRIERMISEYSLDVYNYYVGDDETDEVDADNYLLLRDDFEKLIEDIREAAIPSKYVGLFAWLINRAFCVTPNMQSNTGKLKTTLNKNKSLLLKTLYDANPEALLKCFAGHVNPTPSEEN